VQLLYCAEMEGRPAPASLREPFWDFMTESERRCLLVATFRTLHHLAQGRDGRLQEFHERLPSAMAHLRACPPAAALQRDLELIAGSEATWSAALVKLERLPLDDDDAAVAANFSAALAAFFLVDRDLASARQRFLDGMGDFPALRGHLEAVAASVRRLQRLSDRLRMVENPEKFPGQVDLTKLREAKASLIQLRAKTDELVDAVLAHKETLDATLAAVVDNYAPERIDAVDRAVLRLGAYELLHTSTPRKVAINEAIELARRFGTSDSHRFVNGVLDRIAKQP
jgi:transcription antitermination factor NusB